MHFATCDATLEQWGGNSANDAVWWPTGCPAMDHVDIPSPSNKINAAQQLTIRNADGGGCITGVFLKFTIYHFGGKKPKNSHVTAKNVLCDLDF